MLIFTPLPPCSLSFLCRRAHVHSSAVLLIFMHMLIRMHTLPKESVGTFSTGAAALCSTGFVPSAWRAQQLERRQAAYDGVRSDGV